MVRGMRFSTHLVNHFFILMLLLSAHSAFALTISVKTDRDPVLIDESFQLIFEADGAVDGDPDFSPLNKDFEVLSTTLSSNMRIINARISSTKQWQLTVLARRAGKLTIPAIAFGKDRSQATTITVAKSLTGADNSHSADRKIFIEVEASELKPQVQSQVLYSVKLYRSVNISNASLSDPEVSGGDAVIERLGEDQSYDTWIGGRRYIVVERNYAIYPQRSERLTLAPIRFQGQMAQDRFSMFDLFGSQAQTVIRQSAPLTLDVQAIPAAFSGGHWLPAKHVSLMEQWSGNPLELEMGEPITRTLILAAEGQTASQLPELPAWSLPDFKQYPDQPALSDQKSRAGITGTRREKMAIIPNRPGNYTLPEIKLPWWNTEENRLEYTELPARQIVVLQAANDANDMTDFGPAPIVELDLNLANEAGAAKSQATEPGAGNAETSRLWQYVSLVLGAVWFATLLLWWRSRKAGSDQGREDKTAGSVRRLRRVIKQASQHNDAERVKEYLLQWAHLRWADDPPMSIGEIGKRSSEKLAEEIRILSNSLYSAGQHTWDGSAFWAAFESEPVGQKETQGGGRLEPLYKL